MPLKKAPPVGPPVPAPSWGGREEAARVGPPTPPSSSRQQQQAGPPPRPPSRGSRQPSSRATKYQLIQYWQPHIEEAYRFEKDGSESGRESRRDYRRRTLEAAQEDFLRHGHPAASYYITKRGRLTTESVYRVKGGWRATVHVGATILRAIVSVAALGAVGSNLLHDQKPTVLRDNYSLKP
jgi:hypothetical protein